MNERPINSGTLIALKYWKYQEQFKEFIINAQSQLPPKVREALENQLTREASKKILQNQIDWNTPEAKTALLLAPDGYDDVLRDRYVYDLIANSNLPERLKGILSALQNSTDNTKEILHQRYSSDLIANAILPESMKDALSEISGTDNIKNLLPQVITLLNLPEYMRDTLLASDIPDEFLFSWNAETFSNTESLLQQMEQFIIQFSEKLDVHKRVLTEELDKLEDWVQQMEQSRSSHDANASSESGASSFTPPTSGDSDATSDGELAEGDEEGSDPFNEVSPQEGETGQDETEIYHSKEGYMRHPSIVIPPLAHLSGVQLKKLDLVSSLFPNIPPEAVMEQLMLQSSEQSTHPGLAAIRDSYPRPIRQNFEELVRDLNDDQISSEDFQTRFETFQTHLEEDPLYREILEAIMTRPDIETGYVEAQESFNRLIERLRDEHPELMNEVEEYRAFIDELDGVFNPPQSEAATDATGTTGALETSDAGVIVAKVSNIMQTTAMRMFGHVQSEAATDAAGTTEALEIPPAEVTVAQEVSNIVQTDTQGMFEHASAFGHTSILARIIWRNLKHLQDFYKGVGKLRNDVEALNQKYADGEITREDYELGVDEAVRGLEELFRERVSKPLDAIYPNWASKVLGIKEENRPGEDNALPANSEPSGEELAQELIEHIADGDFYFAAAVDYIVPSMTEPQLDTFLTEIRNRVSTEESRYEEPPEKNALKEKLDTWGESDGEKDPPAKPIEDPVQRAAERGEALPNLGRHDQNGALNNPKTLPEKENSVERTPKAEAVASAYENDPVKVTPGNNDLTSNNSQKPIESESTSSDDDSSDHTELM